MTSQFYEQDIEKLNSLLRGELSAVETYKQCIEKMDEPVIIAQLRLLQSSHARRVTQISQKIRELGGTPKSSSGPWGTFAKLVEGSAKLFGKSAAISALEEGEDHGKNEYADLDDLSVLTREFVTRELVPEQCRSHDILSELQDQKV